MAIKRTKLALKRIKSTDGTWLEDFPSISAHATDFFTNLLSEEAPPDVADMAYFLDFIPSLVYKYKINETTRFKLTLNLLN